MDLWRALVGLEGRIADWRWTFSVADAKSDAVTVQTGVFSRERFGNRTVRPGRVRAIVCGPPDPATGVVAGRQHHSRLRAGRSFRRTG